MEGDNSGRRIEAECPPPAVCRACWNPSSAPATSPMRYRPTMRCRQARCRSGCRSSRARSRCTTSAGAPGPARLGVVLLDEQPAAPPTVPPDDQGRAATAGRTAGAPRQSRSAAENSASARPDRIRRAPHGPAWRRPRTRPGPVRRGPPAAGSRQPLRLSHPRSSHRPATAVARAHRCEGSRRPTAALRCRPTASLSTRRCRRPRLGAAAGSPSRRRCFTEPSGTDRPSWYTRNGPRSSKRNQAPHMWALPCAATFTPPGQRGVSR